MKKSLVRRTLIVSLITLSVLNFLIPTASAWLRTSFQSSEIKISAPEMSGLSYNGAISIEGQSSLERVWFCVRGPAGELEAYPADVNSRHFQLSVPFRFGPGKYTIWAGDNATSFDGNVRFIATNKLDQDNRYISPSAYIDSDKKDVVALANEIVKPEASEMEKLKAIHSWVTKNIAYDYQAYITGQNQLTPASETIKSKKGVCRDYAFVVAALSRASGLQARVVYGDASNADKRRVSQKHAWNEVMVNGLWVMVDATWDAGYIRNGSFVQLPTTEYFNPNVNTFALTHVASTYTLH